MGKTTRLPSRRSAGPVRSEASRFAILTAAQRVLDRDGAGEFTIEAVAREARASKPTIYRWWGDKQTLLGDVYRQVAPSRVSSSQGATVSERLTTFYAHIWTLWSNRAYASTSRWLFRSALQSVDAMERYRTGYFGERVAPAAAILRDAKASNELPNDVDIELVLDLVVGYHMLRMLTGRSVEPREIEDSVAAAVSGAIAVAQRRQEVAATSK
jgi:AcrR family transcriptional regulator